MLQSKNEAVEIHVEKEPSTKEYSFADPDEVMFGEMSLGRSTIASLRGKNNLPINLYNHMNQSQSLLHSAHGSKAQLPMKGDMNKTCRTQASTRMTQRPKT